MENQSNSEIFYSKEDLDLLQIQSVDDGNVLKIVAPTDQDKEMLVWVAEKIVHKLNGGLIPRTTRDSLAQGDEVRPGGAFAVRIGKETLRAKRQPDRRVFVIYIDARNARNHQPSLNSMKDAVITSLQREEE